jgi:hypothetical protein
MWRRRWALRCRRADRVRCHCRTHPPIISVARPSSMQTKTRTMAQAAKPPRPPTPPSLQTLTVLRPRTKYAQHTTQRHTRTQTQRERDTHTQTNKQANAYIYGWWLTQAGGRGASVGMCASRGRCVEWPGCSDGKPNLRAASPRRRSPTSLCPYHRLSMRLGQPHQPCQSPRWYLCLSLCLSRYLCLYLCLCLRTQLCLSLSLCLRKPQCRWPTMNTRRARRRRGPPRCRHRRGLASFLRRAS